MTRRWQEDQIDQLPGHIQDQIAQAGASSTRGPSRRPEQELQIEIIRLMDLENFPERIWRLHAWLQPPVKIGEFIHHTPNGGGRSKAEAGIFKAMGVRAGYPDLSLDLALVMGDDLYPGWRCELKIDNNKLRPNQILRAETLRRAGYVFDTARTVTEFTQKLDKYLSLGIPLYRGCYG